MIIQKRVCDDCKKELVDGKEKYFKANINVVGVNHKNSVVNGEFCEECFKKVCEGIQKEEEKEKEMAIEA